jgi:hypothetical protein
MTDDKKTQADKRNEMLAQRFPDPEEFKKGQMPPVVQEAMVVLRDKAPILRQPVPQGLSDFDALGVTQRRGKLEAQLANAEGVLVASLRTARAYRMITVEQYREQMLALEAATRGPQEPMPFMPPGGEPTLSIVSDDKE